MPVYQATYRAGAQRFFEMDTDEGRDLLTAWEALDEWESNERASMTGIPNKPPPRIFTSGSGAGINLADLTGFSPFISPAYAIRMSAQPQVAADEATG